MFFYNFNNLDNYIKENFIDNLIQEKEKITTIKELYSNKKILFSNIITNIIDISNSIKKSKLEEFYNITSTLKASFEQIEKIENTANTLEEDIKSTISLYDKGIQYNKDEIKANLVEYNKKRDTLLNNILEFEKSSTLTLNSAMNLFSKKIDKNNIINYENTARVNIELEPHDSNILIVSEKDQKAYLPYFYDTVKNIYENSNNKYKTMQDVIDNLYVIPLDNFKNSSISRFREAFNLIRIKEHSSILKGLDLGLELMFKYNLNPIIIAACRNIDELDIYLDCLEENQLYDFKCFEIKFEVSPKTTK